MKCCFSFLPIVLLTFEVFHTIFQYYLKKKDYKAVALGNPSNPSGQSSYIKTKLKRIFFEKKILQKQSNRHGISQQTLLQPDKTFQLHA